MWETPDPVKNFVTETQEKFMSWKQKNLARGTGWPKLGMLILAGLIVATTGRAQFSFYDAWTLMGDHDSFTFDTGYFGYYPPDPGCPRIAGFAPNEPVWYQWTAPADGEVELDTIGSYDDTYQTPLNTVLAVFTGNPNDIISLNQVAANDDIYPVNDLLSWETEGYNYSGSGDYANLNYSGSGFGLGSIGDVPIIYYSQPYHGPSHLRFNAQAGTTYFIAADSQEALSSLLGYSTLEYFGNGAPNPSGGGGATFVLHLAYKSSGVFRFASEDMDLSTGLSTNTTWTCLSGTNFQGMGHLAGFPLYQCAQTESSYAIKYVPEGNSVKFTYYNYDPPGVLVTVTRVAGSTGRATVRYRTWDGSYLTNYYPPGLTNSWPATNWPIGDLAAHAGVDYGYSWGNTNPVSGTLVFDDFEMSKTILIPIIDPTTHNSFGSGGNTNNTFFCIQLIDDTANPDPITGPTSPLLDPLESGDVAPPRVDPFFNLALVKILNVNADPYGPDLTMVITTNLPPHNVPPLATNYPPTLYPTNPVFNFQKCHFRVPADVTDSNNPNGYPKVTMYARRSSYATNTTSVTMHFRVNNYINDQFDSSEEWNNWFPLEPGSDYAVPTPATFSGQLMGTNSDFNMVQGDMAFAANGADEMLMPVTFTVTNSTPYPKFNRDFKIEMYQMKTVNNQNVPVQMGMVGETTVTILFNDLHPPAGSVDELYNADFNGSLALPAPLPATTPPDNPFPGVSGVVNSLLVLPNNETLIAGNFSSYNGSTFNNANQIHGIALVDTNGTLDQSFAPASGADNGPIDALAAAPNNRFVVGGNFTSFNGFGRGHVARVNADGTLDMGFNASASNRVWAVAVQPDGKVMIGGEFTSVNNQARKYLARLNTDGSLDATFDPGNTLTGPVYALALPPSVITAIIRNAKGDSNEDDQVISLGNYTSGTLTVNYDMYNAPDDMRVFYGDTNVAAGTGVRIYDTGSVSGSNTLVIPFGPINGLTTNLITIVMDQGGAAFSTGWTYKAQVNALQSFQGIIAGGEFGVSGQSYANIARFTTNGSLDTTFKPLSGANYPVYTLAWQPNGKVVAGGAFTYFNGIAMNRLVRLNTDGSLDATGFFPGLGADDTVWSITLQPDGTIYVGGQFSSFNGTHRLGFTRLYANGTVDTTFLDTAYNQFAGLKKIYSYDAPAVYASGVQSDGYVMIGGSFNQVGGGQANANICNVLDDQLSELYGATVQESFSDPNLWVEPKTRDGVRNRSSIARLIGGSTPGPGNISLPAASFAANKSQGVIPNVGLVRTNGMLGPSSANFSIQPGTALSGTNNDFSYDALPPQFWVAWRYSSTPTRLRGDGLFGIGGHLQDVFFSLIQADAIINTNADVTVGIFKDPLKLGNLNARFQLANPAGADEFYLGGENIPLGAALGQSEAPFTVIDDTKYAGTLGFASSLYVATNTTSPISLVRSNGTYNTATLYVYATNGTAVAGQDFYGLTNWPAIFLDGYTTNFPPLSITNKPSGLIATQFVEKTVNLSIRSLSASGNAALGITNAVLRLINPGFRGFLTFSATNYVGSETAGFITFVVNRVAGNYGTLAVTVGITNGLPPNGATNGADFIFNTTTNLRWVSGDSSSRTVSIPLINHGVVGTNKQFRISLSNPQQNNTNQPTLFFVGSPGSITNATMTITNDNSYGAFQFSAPSYIVNENGGHATITVLRTGGIAGPCSINYGTSPGANTTPGSSGNYDTTSGTLIFATNQTAASFDVQVHDDGVQDPPDFYFNVNLSNPTNAALGSPSTAQVNILDVESYNWPPGSQDGSFNAGMNGDVLALALQPNGQILAGGSFTFVNGVPESGIARLNADGSLDSSGFLNGYSGASGAVQAEVCQTDGRVVIGGAFTNVDGIGLNRIARLMSDGSLDTSFAPGPAADAPVYALAETFINGSRRIYVGGAFNTINGGSSPNLARLFGGDPYTPGGSLDAAFATGSGPNGPVYALVVYPTNSPFAGQLLVGGAFTNINGFALGHVARLNADGSVDTSFDLNQGANDIVRAIAIQTDGRILLGGDFTNFNGTNLNRIARLNSDGSLDNSFTTNLTGGVNGSVQAIAVQDDNRIVVAGQFTQANGVTRNRVTRLLPNGAVDPWINFGDGANGAINALAIQVQSPYQQMLVIGGGFTQFDDQPAAHIARIFGGSMIGNGAFEFTSANYQVDETGGQALITVRRTGGTSGPNADGSGNVSVHFATTDGTAVAGTNYQTTVTNLNFPPGEVFETVGVPVMDDRIVTNNLTVNLSLTNIPPGVIGNQPTAVLTIINDDSAVSFSAANYSVTKNVLGGFATIDITRQGGINGTCSVNLVTTTNGTATAGVDYWPTNATVNFYPGDTDKQIQVPIINNTIPEGYRTVIFALTNAVNTVLYSPSNATLTIIDTVNAPGQLYFSATNYVVNESDGVAVITVLRTNGTTGNVSATVSTVLGGTAQPGVSYVTNSGPVNFNNGDTSKTFTVSLVQNNLVLGTVTFLAQLSNPSGATLIAPTNTSVSISDKNTGFVFATATNTVIETAGYVAVNVLRIGDTSASNHVDYTTVDGTAKAGVNYQSQHGTLGFGIGESLRSIQVPLIYDPQVTGNLFFTIVLSNPGSGMVAAPGTNTVVVQDADAGLCFSSPTNSVLKNAGSVLITVITTNTAVEPLSVQYSTANGTATAGIDYQGTNGTLVFTNGIGTNTFPVIIYNNGLTGNRTFTVSLTNATAPGQVVWPSNQVVTIIDSNSGLSFSNANFTVLKSGVAANINVFRTGYADSVVSVNFRATNGTALAGINYWPTNGTLVFTNGVTNQAFSVRIINTTAVQPDETVLLQLLNPINGVLVPPSAAVLTIHDTSGSYVLPAGSALVSESGPTNGIIDPNETVTLLFAFRDAGGNDVQDLKATLLATNGVTSPYWKTTNSPVGVDYGYLAYGGHSLSQPFTFTAKGTNGQQIAATFLLTNVVNNIGTNLGTAVFGYTLGTWTTVVSNTAVITINAATIASPYPSTIDISGLGGSLVKATITLNDLWHPHPYAIDALLVSPSQLDTLFMAHCGGSYGLQNVTITFDDAAATNLPNLTPITTIPNAVITNKPTANLPVQPFP